MVKLLIESGHRAHTALIRLVAGVEVAIAEIQTPSTRSRILRAAPIPLTTIQRRTSDLSENTVDLEQVRPNHPQLTCAW